MFDSGTQVSITDPTIKKIVEQVSRGYRGKKIKVVQLGTFDNIRDAQGAAQVDAVLRRKGR